MTGSLDCRRIIDYERYPIDRIDDPRRAGVVASVKSALADDGCAVLRGFFSTEGLATLQTLHAVAPRSSAAGRSALERLNQGLTRMRGSGEWFSTLQKLRAEAEAAQTN